MKGDDRRYRRIRYEPGHPLAGPSGLVSEARAVLYEKEGPGPLSCAWCQAEIRWAVGTRGHQVGVVIADHVNSDPMDDSPENVVAACSACNSHRDRRVLDHEPFRIASDGTRRRCDLKNCLTCGEEFLARRENDPKKGLYCSHPCAGKGRWAKRRSQSSPRSLS